MRKFSVDRFEGDIAVLIDEQGASIEISREMLPDGCEEGEIICFDGKKYSLDIKSTEAARSEVRALLDELFE